MEDSVLPKSNLIFVSIYLANFGQSQKNSTQNYYIKETYHERCIQMGR